MNVVISIRNRDAIPVRALPYVTGWSIAPDGLALELAETSPLQRLTKLRAHYEDEQGGLVELLPKEWDRIVADSNESTAIYKLLNRYKYDQLQIENFHPAQHADTGPAVPFSPIERSRHWTPFYNPSGRYLSFAQATEFLCTLPGLSSANEAEVEAAILAHMDIESDPQLERTRIMPLNPLGHGIRDPERIRSACFTEGSILMLAVEDWGANFDGWDAITRRKEDQTETNPELDEQVELFHEKHAAIDAYDSETLPVLQRRLPIFKVLLLEYAKEHLQGQIKPEFASSRIEGLTLHCFRLPLEMPNGHDRNKSGKQTMRTACYQWELRHRKGDPTRYKKGSLFANDKTFDRDIWQKDELKALCGTKPHNVVVK